jgi:MOSC domain-containing protein YiiM
MSQAQGKVVAISISTEKGVPKKNIERGVFKREHGLEGDAHAGNWHRQVSLLALESIKKMIDKGLQVAPGDFAENITTVGINLVDLPIGAHLKVGQALMEVTQIGKKCHGKCAVYERAGDCIMPREGIFVRVLQGGEIKTGDPVIVE